MRIYSQPLSLLPPTSPGTWNLILISSYSVSSADSLSFRSSTNTKRGAAAPYKGDFQEQSETQTGIVDRATPKKPIFTLNTPSMPGHGPSKLSQSRPEIAPPGDETSPPPPAQEPLKWDWDVEHEDRKLERKHDAALRDATPFEVDRRLLKDVVREKMGVEVGRIKFLSAGALRRSFIPIA